MELFLTVNNDGIVRYEEDGGSSVTYQIEGESAYLLSLQVPKGDREEGIGSTMLLCTEQELISRGIKNITVDFSDSLEPFIATLKTTGYEIKETVPIVSIDMKGLISSPTVVKAMESVIKGVSFSAFSELDMDRWDDIITFLQGHNLKLTYVDMTRFSQELSGVTYDEEKKPVGVILCTENEGSIHVDLLVGQKGGPQYIVAAIQGMLTEALSSGGATKYSSLTMVAANDAIRKLISRVLKNGPKPEKIGKVLYAEKKLYKKDRDYDVEESLDEDLLDEWRRELRKIPIQGNIAFKMPWIRESGSGESVAESRKVDIDYDKEEDVSKGLSMDNTVRITSDNVDTFEEFIEKDVFEDIMRPFYRGLAVFNTGEDEPAAVGVWELKNAESENDTDAEMVYLTASDSEACKTLILEYSNEIAAKNVNKSYFEFEELSESNGQVLSDQGFEIEGAESRDIIVTVGELMEHEISRRKALNYVKNIGSLTEKQFKRAIVGCLLHNSKGLLEDIAFLPKDWFDTDVSSTVMDDGRVTGLLLCHRKASGMVLIDLLYSAGNEYRIDAVNMIRYSVEAASKKYGRDAKVILRRHNDAIKEIVYRLFPDKKGEAVVIGSREE